jgi:predicted membrane channel-forming protein YqfA (hemolysin III family)
MAIIVTTVASIIAMVLWVYTNLLSYFLYASFGWMVMQAFASVAGIVFPWRRKDIFDASPDIVKKKVAGIPLISLLGVGCLICSIYIGWASVAPAYQGTFQPGYLGFSISLMIIGAIIYGISWAYRRQKGLPLELTFREIPPE